MLRSLIIIVISLLTGCASVDVTNENFSKNISGVCLETTDQVDVIAVRGLDKERVLKFTSNYLILSGKNENHRFKKRGTRVKELEFGTKLKITKIIDYPYGSSGHCWVVKAKIYDSELIDKSVELPSCWVWDEPIWVAPKSPHEISKGNFNLDFSTKYLKGSSGCT